MGKFMIKYETHGGECHVDTIVAYSELAALCQLTYDCKIVYWIKKV